MANQMIALQTRNPQLPDPSRITAQYANMMNMASQQRASQLQGERIRQEMDYARAGEGRAIETQTATMRDKDAEFQDKELKRLGRVGVAVLRTEDPTLREAAYQTLLGEVEKADPRLGATMRQVAPTFNAAVVESAVMEVDKYFNAKYPNATYSNEIADAGGFDAQGRPIPAGTLLQVRNSVVPEVAPIPSATAARAPTPVPTAAPRQTTPGPIPVGKYGEDRVIPDNAVPLTDFEREDIRRIKEGSGMTNTPASFTRGGMATPTAGQMSPDMVPAILDSAVNTGVMAQIDLDQMIALAPPQARDGIMKVIRDNNISLQTDAPSLAASGMGQQPMAPNPVGRQQSQFADMRGPTPQASFADLGGQPPMQDVRAQYQPVQRRDPNMAPYPGSARVPISRVAAEAQAGRPSPKEEADKKRATTQVEIEMAPALAKATKSAERTFQLKAEAPKERGVATRLIANIDDRINTIDRLLRNPERRSIVGRFEGNIPYLLQNETQADAQADFDRIKNTDTLTSLVEMKQDSPTGGSPVGNASNQDVLLVARGANSLIQTGSLSKFDSELMNIRRQLYNARVNAIKTYNDVYGDVIASDPRLRLTVPAISDRYLGSKGLGKKGTSTKVDYNNPLLKGMKR